MDAAAKRDDFRISAPALIEIVRKIFERSGSSSIEAELVAGHLVESNLVGHDSHGVIRVKKYIDWLNAGDVLPNKHAEIVRDQNAAVLIDGGFGYGQVIGTEAMTIAAARARENCISVIGIRNSGHLGRIGAWAEQLAEAGLVSAHFVNTSGYGILVAPHGGRDRRLSANPVAAGAPRRDGPPLVLDIATSSIAEGKIQVARARGAKLPAGSVIDGAGQLIDDPEAFYADPPGAILPFGGHKGSGLSVFCEVLAGSLTGGFASNADTPTAHRLVNNMMTLAIDPQAFAGLGFLHDDLDKLTAWIRGSPPMNKEESVLLPGDAERRSKTERTASGIPLDPTTRRQIADVARAFGIATPELDIPS